VSLDQTLNAESSRVGLYSDRSQMFESSAVRGDDVVD